MNKHDMAKVRNGARGIGMVLRKCNDLDSDFDLDDGELDYLEKARMGLLELLASDKERLEQRLTIARKEYAQAQEKDFDYQLELDLDDEEEEEAPRPRKPKKAENSDPDYPEPGDGGGVDPKDGEQLELAPTPDNPIDKLAETITDVVMQKGPEAVEKLTEGLKEIAGAGEQTPAVSKEWSVKPDVPDHIRLGLVEHIKAKKTRSEAIKLVCAAVGLPKLVMDGHFEKLVAQGAIIVKGRSCSVPDAPPAPPEPEPAPKVSLQEMILAELRRGVTDIGTVQSNVTFQAECTAGDFSMALMALTDDGRVDELVDGHWVAIEPGDVPTEEVDGAAGDQAEPEKPTMVAIKRVVSENKGGDRDTIVEMVAMELELPAEQVLQDWKTLVFGGIIRRGPAGWIIAPEMDPED